jgi:sigma-B regulation protein RsbU (phosphoserine phosphatase)
MILASNKIITSPIRQLSAAAKKLVEEEEAKEASGTEIFKQLTIRSQDEIGELYDSLSQMEEDINTYIKEMLAMASENERISAELSLANRIQTGMIPHIFPAFPDRKEFTLYASMKPAKEVGGDFYDFFLIDDDHLGLVIADVSGKGVPAALFMMVSKIIIQSYAMQGGSAAEILTRANQTICSNNQEEMFVTVWLGILEISTGKITAANAGHEYPALKHPDGSFQLFRDKHGFVIGGMDTLKYKEYDLQLEPGAKLFVYTDGVPEATNKKGEMFGTDRMIDALNKNADAVPEKLLKNVRKAVDGFVKDAEQFDDLTMLCMEYLGPHAEEEPAPKKHSAKEKTKKDNENDNDSTE